MTYLGSDRFIVRELEGYAKIAVGGGMNTGLSIQVIDRAYCCAVVASWQTEEQSNAPHYVRRARIRDLAANRCAELNQRYA